MRRLGRAVAGALLIGWGVSSAKAGGPWAVNDLGQPMAWDTAGPVVYNVDPGPLGLLSNTEARALVADAFAVWEAGPANIGFSEGAPLSLDVNATGFAFTNPAHFQNFYRKDGDGKSPVIFDHDGSIIEAVFGLGARFEVLGVAGIDTPIASGTQITGASIIINGAFYDGIGLPDSPEDVTLAGLKAVMVHEIGHFINLDHTWLNHELALDDNAGNDIFVPSMFPLAVEDDAAFADTNPDDELAAMNLYPPGAPTRTISGSVSFAGSPFQGANVVIRKGSDPLMSAYSIVSGALFPGNPAAEGSFSADFFPAGSDYRVCVEQIDTRISVANNTFVGPLATPPVLGGPEECFDGAEAGTQADDPDDASAVTAGVGPVASIVLNALPSTDPFEPNDTLGTGSPLDDLAGGTDTVRGVFGAGDLDVFNVPVVAGQRVRIDLEGAELGSPLDAVVGFYSNAGALVALSDDAVDPDSHAFSMDPALELIAGFTGVGKVVVSSFPDLDQDGVGGGTTGGYWLRVEVATDTDGDGAADLDDICPLTARDDSDRDGYCFGSDNCPTIDNPSQAGSAKINGALTGGGDVFDFYPTPDGARVVYLADKDTDEVYELYAAPAAGGASTKLNGTLVSGGDVQSWVVSPDGSTVVYKADQVTDGVLELFSVPIGGGTATKLNGTFVSGGSLTTFGDFGISPDGTKVLYVADQDTDGVKELYIVPIGGGASVKLNGALGVNQFIAIGPVFTADSAKVLYRLVDPSFIDLYVVSASGGASTQLNTPGTGVNRVVLSPDGTRVIFDGFDISTPTVWSVPITGGTPTVLNGALPPGGQIQGFSLPTNGTRIVYMADKDTLGINELYSVAITGGASTKLNAALTAGGDVTSWQSAGSSMVTYAADQDDDGVIELYSVPITGGTPVKLNGPVGDGVWFWNTTPTRVIYSADQDTVGVNELYGVPIGGGTPVKLSAPLPPGGSTAWAEITPDGATVVYQAEQDTVGIVEMYSGPITGGLPTKLSGNLTAGEGVEYFYVLPDSSRVFFLADQDTDDVFELYSTGTTTGADTDVDGILNGCDSCPAVPNAGQIDADGNGVGDACEGCGLGTDPDADAICGAADNCPTIANVGQADFDLDGAGDACDVDDDNDGLTDAAEAQLGTNPLDADSDNDGVSDGDEVAQGTNPNSPGVTSPAVPFHARRVITAAADLATSVAAADVDGDGDMDILSASYLDDKIAWYENNGASPPAWTPRTISLAANNAVSVAAADVDGDGDMDVLSASFNDDKIAWYENNGAAVPSWTARTVSTAADGAYSVSAADVDGDGDIDVLSASINDDKIAWYESDGASPPVWTARTISSSADGAKSVFPADVDGDGDIDALSASSVDDTIAWYENNGAVPPTWTARTISTSADGAGSVFAADVDGDGDIDAVSASYDDDKIAWYESNGASPPTWTARTISLAADGAFSVIAADVDGDGDKDALSASINDNELAWYENDGASPPVWTARIISTSAIGARSVFAVDVDGDGDTDVLSASEADDTVAWYENRSIHRSASFSAQNLISSAVGGVVSVDVGDIDGDGDLDTMHAAGQGDTIKWFASDGGHPPAWTARTIGVTAAGLEQAALVDLDRDGDLDVLWAAGAADTVGWFENGGEAVPGWTYRTISTSQGSPLYATAADLDGDGDLDVVASSQNDRKVSWYRNNGARPPSFTEIAISVSGGSAFRRGLAIADMDRDGDMDIVAAVPNLGIHWYQNDGAATPGWTEHVISDAFGLTSFVDVADVNGDGDLDVAAGEYTGTRVAWFENDGAASPSWTMRSIATGLSLWSTVSATDMEHDGDVDLVATAGANAFAWFVNDGNDPPAWTMLAIATGGEAIGAFAPADLNGDGDVDLAVGEYIEAFGHRCRWWENRGGQFSLATTSLAPANVASGGTFVGLRIDVTSNGRSGDGGVELATLALNVTDASGVSLSSGEANALIGRLRIHLDTGSGSFEADSDPLVATVETLELSPQSIAFTRGDPRVRMAPGETKRFFVVVETKTSASTHTPNAFRLVHQTQSGTTARDAATGRPLRLQAVANVATATITATGDTAQPSVIAVFPSNSSVRVSLATSVVVYFSEDVDPSTAALGVVLYAGSVKVACRVRADGRTVTLDPNTALAFGTDYLVRVTALLRDRSGNPAVPFTSTFETTLVAGDDVIGVSEIGVSMGGAILSGGNADENSGVAVAALGDVNGTLASAGIADLLIGAPNADGGAVDSGKATLVFGSPSLQSSPVDAVSLTYVTATAQDHLGETVARGGDLNGDMVQDFLIGAPRSDQAFADAGAVYLVFGNAGLDELAPATLDLALLPSCASPTLCGVKLVGAAPADLAGAALSTAGDVNGDGNVDILIGAPGAAPGGRAGAGRVYLVYGPLAAGTIDLAGVGSTVPGLVLNGESAGDRFGAAVSSWPDRNGDGFDDLLIGAPGATALSPLGSSMVGAGYVYALQGSTRPGFLDDTTTPGIIEMSRVANGGADQVFGMVFLGPAANAEIGRSLTGEVDIDGNGVKDILIAGNGVAFAIPGDGPKIRLGGTQTTSPDGGGLRAGVLEAARDFGALTFVTGPGNDDPLTIGPAGDVNNDGFEDFIIGSPLADTSGGADAGRAYVIFGSPEPGEGTRDLADVGGALPGVVVEGAEAGDNLGATVGGGFDLNGDGVADGVTGAPFADGAGYTPPNAGETYLIAVDFTCWNTGGSLGTLRVDKPNPTSGPEPQWDVTLTWGGPLVVQIIRGDLGSLRSSGGITNVSPAGCLANNVFTASVTDNTALGFAGYYLMKTPQACNVAFSGAFREGVADEVSGAGGNRDTDIVADPDACP